MQEDTARDNVILESFFYCCVVLHLHRFFNVSKIKEGDMCCV